MRIEVLGSGCVKCKRLEKNVRKAVEEMGLEAEIVKIEGMNDIIDRGIMMTPGLVVDGEVKTVGKVPGVEEIKRMLR